MFYRRRELYYQVYEESQKCYWGQAIDPGRAACFHDLSRLGFRNAFGFHLLGNFPGDDALDDYRIDRSLLACIL